ncbi:MAG: nitroreductase/quinone reductase family protein [Gammaproteobacteria bacterium]|nr:nitroreductase/quinone reductase family protein [Gammaproteobacteria bacterium]
MKVVRIVAIVFGVYVVLGMSIDAAIGYFQPQSEATLVLRTYGEAGDSKDTVLSLRDDNGQLWVESGHWFRGWYYRALANPNVEVIRGESVQPYRAVPVNTDEAVELMTKLMGKGQGAGYWVGRVMLLFAPIKPVRLEPRMELAE